MSHGSHTAIVDFVQGAKESLGWMAGGVRMASQDRLGLRDTKGTPEKPAALEHQVKFQFLIFLLTSRSENWARDPQLSGSCSS